MKKVVLLFLATVMLTGAFAQKKKSQRSQNSVSTSSVIEDPLLHRYDAMQWRHIGPYRGGRSCAVAGVEGKPLLYYQGTTGGGVWKTTDGGNSWQNISDGYFGGSIGAIAVSQSDPNVIYAGGGEQTLRGNVSYGYGMWRSEDAGKTWTSIGLKQSRHIARIRIHPDNPNIVLAAVIGDIYKSSRERGVYKSIDGGANWEKVLYASPEAGACDLTYDPSNHRIMYASTWNVRRTPYSFSSGGEGSALWKSTDGGDSWEDISARDGLPSGTWGISGVAVSPVDGDRIYAIIENAKGGVYRSDDGGDTWKLINSDRSLRQRAWYYTRIYAGTQSIDDVHVMNVGYHQSSDGGKSWKRYGTPHGDHHDLWIDPMDDQRMVIADDGGAQVTTDKGENWTTYYNQPTAQFYRVTTDNAFPFRIYAAQQDNSTLRIASRTTGRSIGERDWEPTAGGESAHIAVHPENNEVVYGGSYDGFLTRLDHRTDALRAINVWPDNPMGHGAEEMKYRFQWNFPIFFSPHSANRLYTASNHLHVSTDEGQSWKTISPDLTRNDSTKLGSSGGPITQDNTSVEYYCTIFAAAESPRVEGLLWTGSDDGLVHVSMNGGDDWTDVTPSGLPQWTQINDLIADPHHDGGCYIAATSYKSGDYQPYLYSTRDYGVTWKRIDRGIDRSHFTRAIEVDAVVPGLLYAGTESGMYLSYNDGEQWYPMQLNLPIVPITDLQIKDESLVVATQGRSLWIMDDLSILRRLSVQRTGDHVIYPAKAAYRIRGRQGRSSSAGTNHASGVQLHYYIDSVHTDDTLIMTILTEKMDTVRSFNSTESGADGWKPESGSHTFSWDMRLPPATRFDGMILWWASLSGPVAQPGGYIARLSINGEDITSQAFHIHRDPRLEWKAADYQEQYDFEMSVYEKVDEAHRAIKAIRQVRTQMEFYEERLSDDQEDIRGLASDIDSVMTDIEETLYQTQNRSGQDPLNFPIRLTNKLAHLNSLSQMGEGPPTAQAIAVRDELTARIDKQLQRFDKVKAEMIPEYNRLIRAQEVKAISLPD